MNPNTKLVISVAVLFTVVIAGCRNHQPGLKEAATKSKKKLEALPIKPKQINSPKEALDALIAGNKRFINGQFEHIHIKRVTSTPEEVSPPFFAILSCTDCKIPPEILFDQESNEGLVLKSPANVENVQVLNELDSTALQPSLKLIVVLGHNDCKTIRNAITLNHETDPIPGLASLLPLSLPSLPNDTLLVNDLAKKNVTLTTRRIISKIPGLDTSIQKKHLKLVGAYYDEKSGLVTFYNNL